MRTFVVSLEGCENRYIEAETASKARYLYWLELSDILLPYKDCFHAIKSRVCGKIVVRQDPQILVDVINEHYKVGDSVKVKMDDGEVVTWTIKHPCTILGGHTAVIWCNEHSSCYAADRVIMETLKSK